MFPPDVVYILKQHEQRAKLQRPAFVITHIQKFLDNEGELCSLDTLQLRLFCKLIRELNPPEGHGKHFPKVQAAMLGVLSAMPVVAEARYCLRNHQANTFILKKLMRMKYLLERRRGNQVNIVRHAIDVCSVIIYGLERVVTPIIQPQHQFSFKNPKQPRPQRKDRSRFSKRAVVIENPQKTIVEEDYDDSQVEAFVPVEAPPSATIEGKKVELNPAAPPFEPTIATTEETSEELSQSFWSGATEELSDDQIEAVTSTYRKYEERLAECEEEGQTAILIFLEQPCKDILRDVSKMSVCELQLATCFLRKALVSVDRASQMSMLKFVFDSLEISLNVLLLICRARLATVQSSHNNQGESEAGVFQELSAEVKRLEEGNFHEMSALPQKVYMLAKALLQAPPSANRLFLS